MAEFHTDALRPSSLPTASLGRRQFSNANTKDASTEDANLDKYAEDWNLRIDKEMKNMTVGLGELVDLADITTTPNPDKSQINALHLKLKTSQLIRSAQSIRDISHELKLMLLLSDQGADVKERDREAAEVGKEVERRRREMGEKVGGMLAGPRPVPQPESGAEARGNREEEGMDVDPVDRDRDVDQDHAVVKEVEADDDNHQEEEDEDEEDEGFEQVA